MPADKNEAIAFIDLEEQQRHIRKELDAAMGRVLDHGNYIMGPEVGVLERDLSAFCGSAHSISCASGTDALLMILMAEGVGPGDAIVCPAFTFTATPEVIALLGATPIFADVDEATFNLDITQLPAALETAEKNGLKLRGIIAVDLFGLPADYEDIRRFADSHGIWVLADAAQSFGATAHGTKVGNFGLATATSFFPAKPLGCYGDGGAIFTADGDLADRLKSIRVHGKGTDKYDNIRIGINGRLDTLQAAILIEKLRIFAGEIKKRNEIATIYNEALKDHVVVPVVPDGVQSVWAQYTIRVPDGKRDELAGKLRAAGIPTAVYYPKPLHHQTAYRSYPIAGNGLPISERLPNEVLSLPMHPYLLASDQERIVQEIIQRLNS
jgi:dTDP-4-amino-4,6-dideoxygalactose transaminase